jgi:hypothetical protein
VLKKPIAKPMYTTNDAIMLCFRMVLIGDDGVWKKKKASSEMAEASFAFGQRNYSFCKFS